MTTRMNIGRNIARYLCARPLSAPSGASFPRGGIPRALQGARCYCSGVPRPEGQWTSLLSPLLGFTAFISFMHVVIRWREEFWRNCAELGFAIREASDEVADLKARIEQERVAIEDLEKLLAKYMKKENRGFIQ